MKSLDVTNGEAMILVQGVKLKDSIKIVIKLKILTSINNKIKQFYLVRRV